MIPAVELLESRQLLSSAGPPAGSLDPTFGTAGITTLQVATRSNTPLDMLALPGGKTLILASLFDNVGSGSTDGAPYLAVMRTTTDGALDASFGQNGVARLIGSVTGNSMALTPDGHILVAARTLSPASINSLVDLVLERLTPDGTVDTGFGNGGMVSTDIAGRDDIGVKILAQPDGKILIAGYDQKPFLPGILQLPAVFLVRYDSAGVLDPTFGAGGKVVASVPGYQAAQTGSAVLQNDGKIVVVGSVVRKEGDGFMVRGDLPQFLTMRFNSDGSLDRTFARRGVSVLRSNGFAADATVGPNGRLYVAGATTSLNRGQQFALVALGHNGSLVPGFGSRGIATASFDALTGIHSGNNIAHQVMIQQDGKPVLVGSASNAGIALARFKANGQFDKTYGSRGLVLTGGTASTSVVAAMQDDGRLGAGANSGADMLLARYISYMGGISGTVQEIPTVMSPPVGLLANWTMYLDLNRNGRLDRNEPTAVTDSSGKYAFKNLLPGVYRVAQFFPTGWAATPHTPAAKAVRVVAATVQQPIDFADARKPIPGHLLRNS